MKLRTLKNHSKRLRWPLLLALGQLTACIAPSAPTEQESDPDDHRPSSGGTSQSSSGGAPSGGASASGGALAEAGGSPSTETGGAPSTGGADMASGGSSASGGSATTALCTEPCQAPNDCVVPSSTATTDANNYECRNGGCVYLGCVDDQECESMSPGLLCRNGGCVPSCATASDCSLGLPAYDADNYECVDAVCIYQGCNSDSECEETFLGDFSCVERTCQTDEPVASGCESASDCVVPGSSAAYDEDNYECRDSACHYLGCRDDAECKSSLSETAICRAP